MKETVLQFGTGNFLRAFLGDFMETLHEKGLYDGNIVIVSPTDSKQVKLLNEAGGRYRLVTRGSQNGETVNTAKEIGCVSRAVNPYRDFAAFLEIAKNPDLRFVVSNTTEAGIAFDPGCGFGDAPAASFPGKLTRFLYTRWEAGLPGLVLLPCELIDNNASLLKEYVLRYARLWELPEAFTAWIETENAFCNTLVDRIVTGYPEDAAALFPEDKLLDVCEPYHFWAIEGDFERELPLRAAGLNVIWAQDISFYKKRKVRILNGAHTSMVFPALLLGLQTVGDCMKDPLTRAFLERYLYGCALPLLGDTEENRAFAKAVTERFENPFLKHKLTSIALNSVSKFKARVLPTMLEWKEAYGEYPPTAALSLQALIAYYKTRAVTDVPEQAEFIKTHTVPEILANTDLWGADLSDVPAVDVTDIRKAMAWSISY